MRHAGVLNRLAKGEESWDAPIPETYGTFLGRSLRLTIQPGESKVQDMRVGG